MKKRSKAIRIAATVILSLAAMIGVVFSLLVFYVYKGIDFEADERLFEGAAGFGSTVFYANAAVEDETYDPIEIEIGGSFRKFFYSYDEIGRYLTDGFVAVEDKIFYEHKGIDTKRTLMAFVNYFTRKEKIFGASTITQQVVKNISGDNQPTLKRKLTEIIRAIHIERKYTKNEILEVYLNVIPMSENIYGVGAASRAYFGKEPSELLPDEAATLIGITNAPTAYNPYNNPESCLKKRNVVLSVMQADGVISYDEYKRATARPINVIGRENREDTLDSWFVETVIDDVTLDLTEKYHISLSAARMMLLGGGYKVYTTMNRDVQEKLESYFYNKDNFPSEIDNGLNFAMAITDSRSGHLVGIVGRVGEKYANRLLNHATLPHIPGSAIKPIALYAPLIDEGKINWATVFDDVPTSFIEENGEYREYPRNSPMIYDGLTTVNEALQNSKNTVAVSLCNIRTPRKIFDSLREDFGFDSLVDREGGLTDVAVAPMALGQLSRGVSLRKLTEGYSALVGDGVWQEATSYLYMTDYKGEVVIFKEQNKKRLYKSSTARIMNQMLMNVTEKGTASSLTLKNKVNTAAKTGTSGDNRDKLFVGYTPYYTGGIWCGYDGIGRSVAFIKNGHIKIWDDIMTDIHKEIIDSGEIKSFSTEGLSFLSYCKDSGRLYCDKCKLDPRGNRIDYGYFTEDNAPRGECDRHILCKYDCETKAIACSRCPIENLIDVALLNIPERAFPKDITVTDAEYVYRDIDRHTPRPIDYALPYFQNTLPEGVYVGRSKGKKQFNSNCYIHDE